MAVDPKRPLSTDEARQRLRRASFEISPGGMVQRHPLQAVLLGLLGGILVARLPTLRKSALASYGTIKLLRSLL